MTTLPEVPENSQEEEPTLPQNQQSGLLWLVFVLVLVAAVTLLPFLLLHWLVG